MFGANTGSYGHVVKYNLSAKIVLLTDDVLTWNPHGFRGWKIKQFYSSSYLVSSPDGSHNITINFFVSSARI